ncbi:hypothetical protein Tco_1350045, partial [Tanacetum coccineum]
LTFVVGVVGSDVGLNSNSNSCSDVSVLSAGGATFGTDPL